MYNFGFRQSIKWQHVYYCLLAPYSIHQYQNQSQSQFQLKYTTNQPNALIPQIDYPLCVCSTWANLIQPIKVWNEWWKFELLFMLLLKKYFFLQKQQSIYFRYLQSLHVYKVLQHWRLPTIFNWLNRKLNLDFVGGTELLLCLVMFNRC